MSANGNTGGCVWSEGALEAAAVEQDVRRMPVRSASPGGAGGGSRARAGAPASGVARYQGPRLTGLRTVIERGEEGYPEALFRLEDPPEALYVVGDPRALAEGIAIVGARKATPYGTSCAKRFARAAALRGVCVISGGARGCDAAAHRAALDAHGTTVAVLGGGCDELYPAAHYGLFQEIVDAGGAVVSEQPWGFPPMRHTFRARNRLIAALAKATLIVEAGLPSGTFSTADAALAANREVLVVPGSIASVNSRGANRLLFQGATPIVDDETFSSVLDALYGEEGALPLEFYPEEPAERAHEPARGSHEGSPRSRRSDAHAALFAALCANPMRIDEVLSVGAVLLGASSQGATPDVDGGSGDAGAGASPGSVVAPDGGRVRSLGAVGSQASVAQAMMALAELEREGRIVRYPDGRYGAVVA